MERFEAVADKISRYHPGRKRKHTHMDHSAMLATIYSPLYIVGLLLVIMWGMNIAGSSR